MSKIALPKELTVEDLGDFVSITLGLPASNSGWVIVSKEDFQVITDAFDGKIIVDTFDGKVCNDRVILRVGAKTKNVTPHEVFGDLLKKVSSLEEAAKQSLQEKEHKEISDPALYAFFFEAVPIFSGTFTSTEGNEINGKELYSQVSQLVKLYGDVIFTQLALSQPVKFSSITATAPTNMLRKASQNVELVLRSIVNKDDKDKENVVVDAPLDVDEGKKYTEVGGER